MMPWYFPWSEGFNKRACRYLLQRYLGQYLHEKLSLEQLSVDLYNGTGTITDVNLDVDTLNDLGEQYNLPVEFVDGYISSIGVSIPWSSLLVESSYVEVEGLTITIQPKERSHNGSMFDSVWGSMTTSMQLAQECFRLENESSPDDVQPFEGLEKFAQTIDSVLRRTKVRFLNTVIRLEHVPKEGRIGMALEMRIKKIDYFDEAGTENTTQENTRNVYIPAAFSTKKLYLEGISLYSDEFPSKARTFPRSFSSNDSSESKKLAAFATASVSPDLPPPHINVEKTMPYDGSKQNSNTNVSLEPDPILIGKWLGRQEIRLKLKQADVVPGPKVEIEVNLGSNVYFLSPRQVYILLQILNGLSSPDLEDDTNISRPQISENQPMKAADFQQVERELQKQMHPHYPEKSLQNQQGWSSQSLEDSDDDFQPLTALSMANNSETENLAVNSDMQSSISSFDSASVTSSVISSVKKSTRRRSLKSYGNSTILLEDNTSELTHFKVRVSNLNVILLHEDILTVTAETKGLVAHSSVKEMKNVVEQFFQDLGTYSSLSVGAKDNEIREKFSACCKMNHLRLSASPLIIEGNENTSSYLCTLTADVSCGNMEIVECLREEKRFTGTTSSPEYCEILTFKQPESSQRSAILEPCFRMKIKHINKMQNSRSHGTQSPKTDIEISMGACETEIDISIIDRINALLNPQPLSGSPFQSLPTFFQSSTMISNQAYFTQAIEDGENSFEHKINLKVTSSSIGIKIRFPIPDLRALHDMERTPWWQRSVRKDVLSLHLSSAELRTSWDSKDSYSEVEISSKSVNGFYQESPEDLLIHFMKSEVVDKENKDENVESGFAWPRLLLKVFPVQNPLAVEEMSDDSCDTMPVSFVDNLMLQMNQAQIAEPSPFSSRRIVYENQHYYSTGKNRHQDDPFDDTEKMILPGDKTEMLQFIEKTSNNSRIKIETNLPNLVLFFPSKHFYEILYNRISTDLFLWEPTASRPMLHVDAGSRVPPRLDLASTLMQETIYQTFSLCKSRVQEDSSSDTDDETYMYHSVSEHKQKHKKQQEKTNKNLQNKIAVTISSNHLKVFIYTPYRDLSGAVLPSHQGELCLEAKETVSYILTGFHSQANTGYISVHSNQATLFHNGMAEIPLDLPTLHDLETKMLNRLQPTVIQSDPGMYTKQTGSVGTGGDSLDMLSLAIKINADAVSNVKTFQVALGVRDATLLYRVLPTNQNWINQFIDFFDVQDLPVAGYIPPSVVTELHLHLWGCAVDYRPLYLPFKAVITMESFSISSNITAQTSSSLLRFIAEDMGLFISNRCDITHVDLKKNYVCVVDLGFFDLSLRITDGKDPNQPRVDLQASNSIVHIRTCSDSCSALQDLLTYFASDGDLFTKFNDFKSEPDYSEVCSDVDDSAAPQKANDQVHDLMAEAMMEASGSSQSASGGDLRRTPLEKSQIPGEIFLFPDEATTASSVSLPASNLENLGDPCALPLAEDSSTDESFCILEDDPGIGIRPKSGEPVVRILTSDPIHLIENYFAVPLGKIDQLKPPKHFPPAVLRYTLQELSLIWHFHGGKDFESSVPSNKKGKEKQVKICERNNRSVAGISYTKSNSNAVQWIVNGHPNNSPSHHSKQWQTVGGPGRRQDILMELQMNKVRFQYEVYPETCPQAARQVLLIHEFEIRDRLATSQFNKFLYQYTSESMPRQTNANMLVIKAVHVRPDPNHTAQECSLKVSLLPLRLNIDQDALLFLYNFLSDVSSHSTSPGDNATENKSPVKAPVMTPCLPPEINEPQQLLIMLEETQGLVAELVCPLDGNQDVPPSSPIFFRSFVFAPDVLIRLDYQGKHVDTQQLGTLAGIIMGLGQLNCSELRLKQLNYRHGLLGVQKLLGYACAEWLEDIKKSQLPGLLSGVGPTYSVVQFVRGIRDLLWLPIEQYRRDGRIVRGLQRGANAFTKSTAMAALELTNRLVQTIQCAAETAYDMVSPGPSIKKHGVVRSSNRKRPSQPVDIREGVANAYQVVKEGLGDTARTIVRVASEEHEQKGISGAVGGVLRQIPPTVVKPIILATEATSNVLGGMRHQLVPDARREAAEKWRLDDV